MFVNYLDKLSKQLIIAAFLVFIYGCGDDESIDCMSGSLAASVSNVIDARCGLANASFELSISGGRSPFEFSLTGTDFQDVLAGSNLIESVPSGNYLLTVRDANGCVTNVPLTIANQNQPSTSVIITVSGCEKAEGSITINASGGEEPYSFSLDSGTAQTENIFSGLAKGAYTALISDFNGCQTTVDINIISGTSYKNEIIPIINMHCAINDCHDGSNTALPDWTDLPTIRSLAETFKNRTLNGTMPPPERPALTSEEIKAVACWIDDGTLNN